MGTDDRQRLGVEIRHVDRVTNCPFQKCGADRLGDLDPDARAVCWVAAWEMVKDGLIPAGELDTWIDAYAGAERDAQVRELLAAIRARSSLPALYLGALGLS